MKRTAIIAALLLISTLLCRQERIYATHSCSWDMCPLQADGVTMQEITNPASDAQCFYRSHYDHPELSPEQCDRHAWY